VVEIPDMRSRCTSGSGKSYLNVESSKKGETKNPDMTERKTYPEE
jgi:hypothetical protein